MKLENIIVAVLIILLLIGIFYLIQSASGLKYFSDDISKLKPLAPEPKPIKDDQYKDYEVDWDKLTDGEKLQYIVDTYFSYQPEDQAQSAKDKSDNQFIASLPQDSDSCNDHFNDCSSWADDGECTINPEFMLYKCPQSCKACSMSEEDKYKLTKIYNSRTPDHCVYHGEDYPGNFQYLNRMYDYTVAINY